MKMSMSDPALLSEDFSGLQGLLENYRRELEEELAQKLEAKSEEFRRGMVKLDKITENTFVAVRKEEQELVKDEKELEKRSRDYIRSLRRDLNRQVISPSHVRIIADFAVSRIVGIPGEKRGESS